MIDISNLQSMGYPRKINRGIFLQFRSQEKSTFYWKSVFWENLIISVKDLVVKTEVDSRPSWNSISFWFIGICADFHNQNFLIFWYNHGEKFFARNHLKISRWYRKSLHIFSEIRAGMRKFESSSDWLSKRRRNIRAVCVPRSNMGQFMRSRTTETTVHREVGGSVTITAGEVCWKKFL